MVRVAYVHSKSAKNLAFVGKGITYDSGGISLKPAGHNETMKCDMSGAAAVFAAVVAAAKLGLEVNVTGWLALAENMPSGSATRPGDVLRMYSGKTVEVLLEGKSKGKWYGRTRTGKLVFFRDSGDYAGHLVKITVEQTSPWSLQGKMELNKNRRGEN